MFSPKIRNTVNIFVINESFVLKDVLIINIYDHQILKIRDYDFIVLKKIDFLDEKDDLIALVKCKHFLIFLLKVFLLIF